MSRADYTELAGVGMTLFGLWVLLLPATGLLTPLSVAVAGVFLVLYGIVIAGSANRFGSGRDGAVE